MRTSLETNFSKSFWLINALQFVEQMAFSCVLMQLSVYIAQKDIPGGLHWDQMDKAVIFFWWALVQRVVPVFSGGFAERYGYKPVLYLSFVSITAGYLLISISNDFSLMVFAVLVLGFGSGLFKPVIQGALSKTMNNSNSSVGWGIYFCIINLAAMSGFAISKELKEISWQFVFWGSAIVFLINFVLILFLKTEAKDNRIRISVISVLREIFTLLFQKRILFFILLMSSFSMIHFQFYETLPNFIYDWSDTSSIAAALPKIFTSETPRGLMISYEWIYNINTILTILLIVPISWLLSKFNVLNSIMTGILIITIGLAMCGFSTLGLWLLFGIVLFTLGEMFVNPKFTQYLSDMAPKKDKAIYMSFLNISHGIGFTTGSLIGGYFYKHFGEKAGFAVDYLNKHFSVKSSYTDSIEMIILKTNTNHTAITEVLWNEYNPFYFWIPFVILGIAAIIGLLIYKKKLRVI